jgi:hypothetical protein
MPVNFNMTPGVLYIDTGDGISSLGYITDIDTTYISANEEVPNTIITIDSTHSAEFECNLEYGSIEEEIEQYERMLETPTKHELFYNVPVMIQRRYHKKPRINKKWLKRYGMKHDEVKIKMNYQFISHNNDDNTFTLEMEICGLEPMLRSDQRIGHRKMEWL